MFGDQHKILFSLPETLAVGKQLAFALLSLSGMFRLGEMLSGLNLVVLTYHRVIPKHYCLDGKRPPNTLFTDEFDKQMAFLAKRFNVLSGNELRAFLEGSGTYPRCCLTITFDDGYENNFAYALPILKKYDLQAVFFVTTNLIGRENQSFWFDRLNRLLSVVPLADIRKRLHQLDPSLPVSCDLRILPYFKTLSSTQQSEILDSLERQFMDVKVPTANKVVHGLMSWDQVRSMVSAGMTIGSHTANHQILSAVSTTDVRQELQSSRERIERETGQACWCFAYPNGERRDFRPSDELAVEDAGYLCAFTQIPGLISRRTPRYALPRIPIPATGDMKMFRWNVSGLQRAFRTVFPEQ